MQHPWDWMDAGFSNIVDYSTGHILTQVLTSNFFSTACIFGQHNRPLEQNQGDNVH